MYIAQLFFILFLVYLRTVNVTKSENLKCYFEEGKSSRIDCGWSGINNEECELRGCCFNYVNNEIFACFYENVEYKIIPIKSHMTKIQSNTTDCIFEKPIVNRRKCGHNEISKNDCENINCCYDNSYKNAHKCFSKQSKTLKTKERGGVIRSKNFNCYFGDPLLREDCGWPEISIEECENRGCCFDNSFSIAKYCFYPNIPKYSYECVIKSQCFEFQNFQNHIYFSLEQKKIFRRANYLYQKIKEIFKTGEINKIYEIYKNPLVLAMKLFDLNFAIKLINKNIGINVIDEFNLTPLHYAAFYNYENITKLLIEKKQNVNVRDIENMTPLHLAASNGHIEIVRILINNFADLNVMNKYNFTPLHIASSNGEIEIFKLLLKNEVDFETLDNNQMTPLIEASLKGHLEIVKLLFKNGADIEIAAKNDYTPLFISTLMNNVDVVKILVGMGAHIYRSERISVLNLFIKNDDKQMFYEVIDKEYDLDGQSVEKLLNTAILNGKIEIVKFIINNIPESYKENFLNQLITFTYEASSAENLEILKIFVEKGVNINPLDEQDSPLIIASSKGNLNITIYLIENNADVNIRNMKKITPLQIAAENGHFQIVKYLIENEANVNIKDSLQFTALHKSTRNNHSKIVNLLLENGANINDIAQDEEKFTALHMASERGFTEIVQILFSYKANVNVYDYEKRTPLFLAASNGHVEILNMLINQNKKMIFFKAKNENTALHDACMNGHFEVVKILIKNGAKVNATNSSQRTCLHLAAEHGRLDIVKQLFKNGVDNINALTDKNETPLYLSIMQKHVETAKYLISKNANVNSIETSQQRTPLFAAIMNKLTDLIYLLIENDADIFVVNYEQETPLHEAVSKSANIVEKLLVHGARVFSYDIRNNTPFWIPVYSSNTEILKLLIDQNRELINDRIHSNTTRVLTMAAKNPSSFDTVKLLLKNDADVNGVDYRSWTALHHASNENHTKLVELLLLYHANVNARDETNETPLYKATVKENVEIVEMLLNKNADADLAENTQEMTPLFQAVLVSGNEKLIRLLLTHKANVNATNSYKWSCLQFASSKGQANIVEILLNYGADVNYSNNKYTSLHLAAGNGHGEVVKSLIKHGADIYSMQNQNLTALDLAKNNEHFQVVKILEKFDFSDDILNNTQMSHVIIKDFDQKTIIGIGLSTSIVILILVFAIVFVVIKYKKKERKMKRFLNEQEIKEFIEGDKTYNKLLNDNEQVMRYNDVYEVNKDKFTMGTKVLGSGNFGIVMNGLVELSSGSFHVAIKMVKSGSELLHVKALLDELKIMSTIGKHENIVSLIAACTKNIKINEIYVAVEYCANGSLINALRAINEKLDYDNLSRIIQINHYENLKKDYEINYLRKLNTWSLEIANGMKFLSENKIIHCDLAARNVLLTYSNNAKICDFGLSRQLFENITYTKKSNCPLPWKWMSIESLENFQFSEKTDVWAYGVTLWEIFSFGSIPYTGYNWSSEYITELKNGMRLKNPKYSSTKMYDLMLKCWLANPDERPLFCEIVQWITSRECLN